MTDSSFGIESPSPCCLHGLFLLEKAPGCRRSIAALIRPSFRSDRENGVASHGWLLVSPERNQCAHVCGKKNELTILVSTTHGGCDILRKELVNEHGTALIGALSSVLCGIWRLLLLAADVRAVDGFTWIGSDFSAGISDRSRWLKMAKRLQVGVVILIHTACLATSCAEREMKQTITHSSAWEAVGDDMLYGEVNGNGARWRRT